MAPALEPMTLPEVLEAHAHATPARSWLTVYEGKNADLFTAERLNDLSRRWAHALQREGVKRADRVVVFLPNSGDFVAAFLGALRLGAIAVPVAWPFFFDSIDKRVKDLGPLFDTANPVVVVTNERARAAASWDRTVLTAPSDVPLEGASQAEWNDPAFIQFTSGSTGRPRGAVISHRAAVHSAAAMGRALRLGTDDIGVSWLPLFHDMGLVGTVFCSLVQGFPLHLMTPSEFLLHPRRWLELISTVRASITVAPNFGYDLATRRIRSTDGLDLSSLRIALSGSEPVHRSTIDAFEERMASVGLAKGTILPVYGLAENTLGVTFPPVGANFSDLETAGRKVPSVGVPICETEVEIRARADEGPSPTSLEPVESVDADDSAELRSDVLREGEEGEIWVRSPALFSGYFEDPAATGRALVDGWLATGDLGILKAGSLYVTGREKELIIKGGQKFHPYEIERVVADALHTPLNHVAAVSVANDAKGTEDLAIVIEARESDILRREAERLAPQKSEGIQPVNQGLDDQALAEVAREELHKRIRGCLMEALGVRAELIDFVPPGTIPRTTSGKLRRKACADRMRETL